MISPKDIYTNLECNSPGVGGEVLYIDIIMVV